jgi:hypothetical protein
MELTFLLPLFAAIILSGLILMAIKFYARTKLFTLLFFALFSSLFVAVMIIRVITTLSVQEIDLYWLSNLFYINGIWLLSIFVDIMTDGKLTFKAIIFSFFAGCLNISQIFLDEYTLEYVPSSGWLGKAQNFVHFGGFVVFAASIIFLSLGNYLIHGIKHSKGEGKKVLIQILIIFLVTGGGVGIFTILRSFVLSDNGILNNLDTICIMIGFGYLQYKYIKHPTILHIDMIDVQLFGLCAYEKESGNLLYEHIFDDEKYGVRNLIGSALKGVDVLFKEILSSDMTLKQVEHGSNFVLFSEGKYIVAGLIVNVSTIVTNNWVYQFRVEFEKRLEEEIQTYLKEHVIDFDKKAEKIVKDIFSYN